jgi:hypothetical protein
MTESNSAKVQMQEGGRRKKPRAKVPKKKVVDSKKAKPQQKRPKVKHGGDLVSDIKNLAIPFAILLAKQGIVNVFDKKKPDTTLKSIIETPSSLIKSVAKSLSPQKETKSVKKPKKTVKKGGSVASSATKVLQESALSAKKLVNSMTRM